MKHMNTWFASAAALALLGCSEPPDEAADVSPPPSAEPEEPAAEPEPTEAPEELSDVMKTVASDALVWEEIADAGGAEVAVVSTKGSGPHSAVFLRLPAGWEHGSHYHPHALQRVVLDGDFTVTLADGTTVSAEKGAYARMPGNMAHASKTQNGALLYLLSEGPLGVIGLDDSGNPTKEGDAAPGAVVGEVVSYAADALPYKSNPDMEGLEMAMVAKNAETESVGFFVRLAPGFETGNHHHTSSFHRLTVDGAISVTAPGHEGIEGVQGEYFRGVGGAAHTSVSPSGTTMFIVTDQAWGTVMLDAEGNPVEAAPAAE